MEKILISACLRGAKVNYHGAEGVPTWLWLS